MPELRERSLRHLSPAQRQFLAGYLPDIPEADNAAPGNERAEFVKRVSAMHFDDNEPATPGALRVARNLKALGLLDELEITVGCAGSPHISLKFSETGAHALFEVMAKWAPPPSTAAPAATYQKKVKHRDI